MTDQHVQGKEHKQQEPLKPSQLVVIPGMIARMLSGDSGGVGGLATWLFPPKASKAPDDDDDEADKEEEEACWTSLQPFIMDNWVAYEECATRQTTEDEQEGGEKKNKQDADADEKEVDRVLNSPLRALALSMMMTHTPTSDSPPMVPPNAPRKRVKNRSNKQRRRKVYISVPAEWYGTPLQSQTI
jgi:hypothetical protein